MWRPQLSPGVAPEGPHGCLKEDSQPKRVGGPAHRGGLDIRQISGAWVSAAEEEGDLRMPAVPAMIARIGLARRDRAL
jgi:hypothetical protein